MSLQEKQHKNTPSSTVYDVVIIGSGMAGLVCGLILAKEGRKVCVLEKNRQYGGALQIFSRDKHVFDTGVHYIGGLGEGQNLYKIFKYLGIYDDLRLKKMDEEAFDVISFGDDPVVYPLAQGHDRFVDTLIRLFPREEKAIRQYSDALKKVKDDFPLFDLLPQIKSNHFSDYETMSARQYIAALTSDETLRSVLAGNNVLYAGNDDSPFHMHALISHSYIEGAWKCVDGGAQIERALSRKIKAHGGELRNYSEVAALEFNEKEVVAARCKDGTLVQGELFISNLHPAKTVELTAPGAFRKAYVNRINRLRNTTSVFTLNVVLQDESFPYQNKNFYHYKEQDVWRAHVYDEASWPKAFAVYFPYSMKSPEYAQTAIILAYMNMEDVAPWADTVNIIPNQVNDRGHTYEAFKEEKAQKLLQEVEKRFPGFNRHIRSYHASTPLTYRDYLGTDDGTIYGIQKDYRYPLESVVSPKTRIPNLYMTGQNTNMHGILGVTISAIGTCAHLMGLEYVVDKINQAAE